MEFNVWRLAFDVKPAAGAPLLDKAPRECERLNSKLQIISPRLRQRLRWLGELDLVLRAEVIPQTLLKRLHGLGG